MCSEMKYRNAIKVQRLNMRNMENAYFLDLLISIFKEDLDEKRKGDGK
jgi:hypothetical protein